VRRLLDIARKDALVLARDRAAVLVLVAMPLALVFILGSALGNLSSGDFRIAVAIVNQDEGEVGEEFVEGITEAEDLDQLFEITTSDDLDAVRTRVEEGDLAAALVIPPDLSETIAARESATVEVLQDPGSTVSAGVWAGVVRAATAYASAGLVIARSVQDALEMRPRSPTWVPNEPATEIASEAPKPDLTAVTVKQVEVDTTKRVTMMSYYAAGMTAMFLLFGSMFGAFTFVHERRDQTFARMLVTPSSKVAIVGGKGLGIMFVGLGQLVVLVFGTMLLFGVDWGEHIGAVLVLGTAEVFAATGLAMTLAALGKTERAIGAIGPAMIMLFAATGGAMFPAEALPSWIRPAQVISPAYWTLSGLLDVIRGAALSDVWTNAAIVIGIGVVLYAFGIWRLRYE
jgi:ABC-2 type transport system permease protein